MGLIQSEWDYYIIFRGDGVNIILFWVNIFFLSYYFIQSEWCDHCFLWQPDWVPFSMVYGTGTSRTPLPTPEDNSTPQHQDNRRRGKSGGRWVDGCWVQERRESRFGGEVHYCLHFVVISIPWVMEFTIFSLRIASDVGYFESGLPSPILTHPF